jgi:hypothetical protein
VLRPAGLLRNAMAGARGQLAKRRHGSRGQRIWLAEMQLCACAGAVRCSRGAEQRFKVKLGRCGAAALRWRAVSGRSTPLCQMARSWQQCRAALSSASLCDDELVQAGSPGQAIAVESQRQSRHSIARAPAAGASHGPAR